MESLIGPLRCLTDAEHAAIERQFASVETRYVGQFYGNGGAAHWHGKQHAEVQQSWRLRREDSR